MHIHNNEARLFFLLSSLVFFHPLLCSASSVISHGRISHGIRVAFFRSYCPEVDQSITSYFFLIFDSFFSTFNPEPKFSTQGFLWSWIRSYALTVMGGDKVQIKPSDPLFFASIWSSRSYAHSRYLRWWRIRQLVEVSDDCLFCEAQDSPHWWILYETGC